MDLLACIPTFYSTPPPNHVYLTPNATSYNWGSSHQSLAMYFFFFILIIPVLIYGPFLIFKAWSILFCVMHACKCEWTQSSLQSLTINCSRLIFSSHRIGIFMQLLDSDASKLGKCKWGLKLLCETPLTGVGQSGPPVRCSGGSDRTLHFSLQSSRYKWTCVCLHMLTSNLIRQKQTDGQLGVNGQAVCFTSDCPQRIACCVYSS